jgi:hypothetical protein
MGSRARRAAEIVVNSPPCFGDHRHRGTNLPVPVFTPGVNKGSQYMSFDPTKSLFALALLGCGVAASAQAQMQIQGNQMQGNQAGYIASGQTASLDCAGGKAAVMGSNNILTIKGSCTELALYGSGNKITIAFAPDAQISFVGSQNTIEWSTADGKPPKVSYVGSGNTLTPPIH